MSDSDRNRLSASAPDPSTQGLSINRAKRKLSEGGFVFATWIQFVRTPAIVRLIASAGFDMVFIDMEHSSLDWETVADMCEMARAAGIAPIVRPYCRDSGVANRIQDIGALGLLMPNVKSRAQVEEFRTTTLYPPSGTRSVTVRSAPTDYRTGDGRDLSASVNREMLLGIQVESQSAIEHIDEILGGGGIDVVHIGRYDLSMDLAIPYEVQHPRILEAVDIVLKAGMKHGVAVAIDAGSPQEARDFFARGVRCLCYGSDKSLLTGGYQSAARIVIESASQPTEAEDPPVSTSA